MKLKNQGLILAEDGSKMSKSKGNVVNPDEVIAEFGADALRLYEMFMGPLEMAKPWSTSGISGVRRFIDKVWRLIQKPISDDLLPSESHRLLHKTIKKVGQDIETQNFNTAISTMMELVNDWSALAQLNRSDLQSFIKILSPFAPHIAEEAWNKLGQAPCVCQQTWPSFDEALTVDDTITLVIQINGKVREKMEFSATADKAQLEQAALSSEKVKKMIDGKKILKVITVPKKLVNIVIEA
jgi:leucyl-tRNA synthetase